MQEDKYFLAQREKSLSGYMGCVDKPLVTKEDWIKQKRKAEEGRKKKEDE